MKRKKCLGWKMSSLYRKMIQKAELKVMGKSSKKRWRILLTAWKCYFALDATSNFISFHFSESNFDAATHKHGHTEMEFAAAMNSMFGLIKNFSTTEKLFFLHCIPFLASSEWCKLYYGVYEFVVVISNYWHRFLKVCHL